ncbi:MULTISPECIES: serine hydrolase domain-containing protein [Streptomyces]|uniref:Class A beta-lactamase-related serine hydrolase n=3 Tax=Streptomyces TaxID=1883 RepID=A0A3R7HLZ8_9ACTN|nr:MULTISPECIES: serine hydrolase domain-containing protein [Streptomyces]KNE84016.1 peptidase [Streptomyces fradiae]PQM24700.1 peptidase [Streptomyces xinghaiensis]RKM98753.1 class A beta-lactamase-related serine hydrolase [Streptomyces xinghaiensis]RNC76347.1 class A beta-lactamase-related serine hydrolase [Streptomyces xinghaiensis]
MATRSRRGRRGTLAAALTAAALAAGALSAPAAAAAGPAAAAAAKPETGRGHAATQKAMDAQVAAGLPGVLLQAVDRHGVWNGSSGVADLETERPRLPKDRFRVGSITKTFVATVLLQLEAERRIDLDDTVEQWLPGVVRGNGNDGRKITVRQLLNHTSGLFDYTSDAAFAEKLFGPGFLEHRYDTWTPEQLVRVGTGHEPDFAPGTDWNYSNTNYILAGMVIERVTGEEYAEEIERRILRPLRLRATTVPGTDPDMPRPHGRAYSPLGGDPAEKIHDVTELNPSVAGAAGEMISTTGDLNRFYRALVRGKVLPDRQLKAMLTTVETGEAGIEHYGLGIYPQTLSCGVAIWGHSGGIHGSGSAATVTRAGDHAASFNANGDWTGDGRAVAEAEYCGTS